jgi:molybdenum cofactor cytidylyltransferase
MTPILILAAGKSSRMRGRDKHLEEIDGVPLLRRLALAALELGEPVFVALPALPHPRAEALEGLDVTLLAIPEAEEGMSGTLRGAVARLPQSEGFLLVLGDLAEIGTVEMRAVMAAWADAPDKLIWRGATETGEPGHPILFDASLIPRFAELSGDGGGESLVKPLKAQTCLVPLPGRVARHDLDTPEDWDAFRKKTPRA